MLKRMDTHRQFLIAHPGPQARERLALRLQKTQKDAKITYAVDGTEAQFKLDNETYNVVFLVGNLPKKNALQVTEWILAASRLSRLAIVIMSAVPDSEQFVEEVVAGRVQFLPEMEDDLAVERCLMRALTYCFHGDKKEEFLLRFVLSGDVLMREGEKADKCYVVKSGRLKAVRTIDGKEVFLGYIEPGEFVGEMAFINGEPRIADVRADAASELIEIPYARLDHVLFSKPTWSKALMKTLTKRLKVANDFRSED